MGAKEHKDQCVAFTGEIAEVAAKIIARELNLTVNDADIEIKQKNGVTRLKETIQKIIQK
ncbi:MAG: hypothetical protein ACRDAQ_10175, partial [Cetobacterium sp.]